MPFDYGMLRIVIVNHSKPMSAFASFYWKSFDKILALDWFTYHHRSGVSDLGSRKLVDIDRQMSSGIMDG